MKNKKELTAQEWIPVKEIREDGILKLKENAYIKILKVQPVNFNLKSELEKRAILNSYKIFLKTCNFDIQILIQSKKEDLSKYFKNLNKQITKEKNNKIKEIINLNIEYLKKINQEKKSSSKNFYILIKKYPKNNENNFQEIIIEDLNDKYFKIKECLSRCGNNVTEINDKKEIKEILFSFLNTKKYLNKI